MERKESFMVKIIGEENATWQGTVTWLDEKQTQNFRSLLELIKLLDDALGKKDSDK